MAEPIIRIESLRKEFGHGRVKVVAVDEVSLTIQRGEIVLLMGPSGSGKTTLLSMMGCILRPTQGQIWLSEVVVTKLPERALPQLRRQQIGFVFQAFNLLQALTARENVEIALNIGGLKGKAARQKADNLLDIVGLGERATFLPASLSGGEKQRVAIARALSNDPPLILADEPTGNLDSKIGRGVMELFSDLARQDDRSVVIVTHDERIRDIADRVLYLEDGRLSS